MLPPICILHWCEPRERGCRRDLSWLKVRMCSTHAYNKVFLYYQELRRAANVCSFLLDSAVNFSGPALPSCLRLVPGLWQAFMEARHSFPGGEMQCYLCFFLLHNIPGLWVQSKPIPVYFMLQEWRSDSSTNLWYLDTINFVCFLLYLFLCWRTLFSEWASTQTDGCPRAVLNGLQWVTSKSNRDPHLK